MYITVGQMRIQLYGICTCLGNRVMKGYPIFLSDMKFFKPLRME